MSLSATVDRDPMRVHTACADLFDPCGPGDWRWQAARTIHEQSEIRCRRRRKRDPEWLEPLRALIRVLADHPVRRRWKAMVTPVLLAAYEIYQNSNPIRWELEARILAAQTDEEIAAAMGLDPAAAQSSLHQVTPDSLRVFGRRQRLQVQLRSGNLVGGERHGKIHARQQRAGIDPIIGAVGESRGRLVEEKRLAHFNDQPQHRCATVGFRV